MKNTVILRFQSFKHSRFITGFKTSMRPNWSFSVRLDEIPCYIAWPLVYLLGFTRITPNQVTLVSFLSGVGFLMGLYQGLLPLFPIPLALLLLSRVLLDCADGQLARYTGQTSNLGALYDLATDLILGIALFLVLGYTLIKFEDTDPDIVIFIGAIALFCFLTSSTVFSYLSFLERSSDVYPAEARKRFIASLANDHPEKRFYTAKLELFNLLFRFTWRLISYLAFILVLNPEKSNFHASALRILAPLEYGTHLTILAIMILLKINTIYFLIFEITAFCVLFLILLYHYRD